MFPFVNSVCCLVGHLTPCCELFLVPVLMLRAKKSRVCERSRARFGDAWFVAIMLACDNPPPQQAKGSRDGGGRRRHTASLTRSNLVPLQKPHHGLPEAGCSCRGRGCCLLPQNLSRPCISWKVLVDSFIESMHGAHFPAFADCSSERRLNAHEALTGRHAMGRREAG